MVKIIYVYVHTWTSIYTLDIYYIFTDFKIIFMIFYIFKYANLQINLGIMPHPAKHKMPCLPPTPPKNTGRNKYFLSTQNGKPLMTSAAIWQDNDL